MYVTSQGYWTLNSAETFRRECLVIKSGASLPGIPAVPLFEQPAESSRLSRKVVVGTMPSRKGILAMKGSPEKPLGFEGRERYSAPRRTFRLGYLRVSH